MPSEPLDPPPAAPAPPVTLERLKRAGPVSRDSRDEELQEVLDGALAFVQGRTRRQLTPLPALDSSPPVTVRRRLGRSGRFVRVPDARSVTSVTIDGETVGEAGYQLHPPGATESYGKPTATYIEILKRDDAATDAVGVVEVTGRFGFAALPADLADAIIVLASRRLEDRSAGFNDAQQSEEYGFQGPFRRLPPAAAAAIRDYTVPELLRLS